MNQSSKTSPTASFLQSWTDSFFSETPKASTPAAKAEDAESSSQDIFLTGLLCLEPVSEGCLSGLLRLWQEPSVEKTPEPCGPAEVEKVLREHFRIMEFFGMQLSEQLREGLSRYLTPESRSDPREYEIDCQVKTGPSGDLKVECRAQ